MKIITLTLNPAFDIHCYAKSFKPFCENIAKISSYDAGGKGINISRALSHSGVCNSAYVVVGNENMNTFLKSLQKDNISYKEFVVSGAIRENITLHTKNNPETRLSFEGFCLDNKTLQLIENELAKEDLKNSVIAYTGRIPDGAEVERIKELLKSLKFRGAKIIVDSKSFTKDDIKDIKPYLIKPNEEEVSLYTDIEVTDFQDAKRAAQEIRAEGVENVMISLGSKGALLCTEDGTFYGEAPKIEVHSTIGAGDSSIAGFIEAISSGESYAMALKNAIAYGSAACMCEGTKPPKKEDIKKIYERIDIKRI